MTHVLDTSAVLAHYLDEPGADIVHRLFEGGPDVVGLAAPTWVELDSRLRELVPEAAEAARVFRLYTQELGGFLPIDASACRSAISVKLSTAVRLPLVDALIAGCAAAAGLTLVHRDPHFNSIPARVLKQLRLADK
jgi:predicted nucleic acid-binding protein